MNKACFIYVIYVHRTLLDSKEKPHENVRISSSNGDEEGPVLTSSGTTLCDTYNLAVQHSATLCCHFAMLICSIRSCD